MFASWAYLDTVSSTMDLEFFISRGKKLLSLFVIVASLSSSYLSIFHPPQETTAASRQVFCRCFKSEIPHPSSKGKDVRTYHFSFQGSSGFQEAGGKTTNHHKTYNLLQYVLYNLNLNQISAIVKENNCFIQTKHKNLSSPHTINIKRSGKRKHDKDEKKYNLHTAE